jgi:hypothetical protein
LTPQIDLPENAFVLALGGKAQQRLKRNGVRVDFCAHHPAAWPKYHPEESWKEAAQAFHSWLKRHGLRPDRSSDSNGGVKKTGIIIAALAIVGALVLWVKARWQQRRKTER